MAAAFVDTTTELELPANHRNVGRINSSFGGSLLTGNFSATALSCPKSIGGGSAAYVHEAVPVTERRDGEEVA